MRVTALPGKTAAIKIGNDKYFVEDTIENITLADSFVKNKIGSGHGEGKLYVGQIEGLRSPILFFNNFQQTKCFLLKKDILMFLQDAEGEFLNPQQQYKNKDSMPSRYAELHNLISSINNEMLKFEIFRADVQPPRIYINSNSPFYDLMRSIGLPNISYLSILRLRKEIDNSIYFYFRIFIDYRNSVELYASQYELEQEREIESSTRSLEEKKNLVRARVGQGLYRQKLLVDCPFCPITLINDERLLIASHIKPWVISDDKEKVDPNNGLMLSATYDKLFDQGLISFKENKELLVSPWISPMNAKRLNIFTGKIIQHLPLNSKRNQYLEFHRTHIFRD